MKLTKAKNKKTKICLINAASIAIFIFDDVLMPPSYISCQIYYATVHIIVFDIEFM